MKRKKEEVNLKKHNDGKVDFKNFKTSYFTTMEDNELCKIYSGVVFTKNTKQDKWGHKVFMTTDLNLEAEKILTYYQSRF